MMKQFNLNSQSFFNKLIAGILLTCLSVSSVAKIGEQSPISAEEMPLQHPYASGNALSNKRSTVDTVTQKDIWQRLRGRLELSPPKHSTRYQRHIRNFKNAPTTVTAQVKNATPYLHYVLGEVEKRGMPSEIALLPMVESEFNPRDRSHKGAVGLWQIMPVLGRMHGLKQTHHYDGRRDLHASTKAALDHLQYLHKRFNGNWPLALAAYNAGEFRVLNAIKRNRAMHKPTDYWSLPLPKETQDYVPKLLAWSEIVRNPKKYGLKLPDIPNKPAIARINVGKPLDLAHVAHVTKTPEAQLRKLNPAFRHTMDPGGPFYLVIPVQQVGVAQAKLGATLMPATPAKKKSNSKPKPIQVAQKKTTTGNGTKSGGKSTSKMTAKSTRRIHVVKKGESIPKICQRYKINTKSFLANNGFKSQGDIIRPGQKVKV